MIPPMTSATPRGSSCRNFSFHEAFAGVACGGVLKKMNMSNAERPPTGKLIQKLLWLAPKQRCRIQAIDLPPAPAGTICEHSSENWTNDTRETIDGSDQPDQPRPNLGLSNECYQSEGASRNTRRPKSSKCASHYECDRVLGDRTDQATDDEDEDGAEIRRLEWEVFEELPRSRLEASEREEVYL